VRGIKWASYKVVAWMIATALD